MPAIATIMRTSAIPRRLAPIGKPLATAGMEAASDDAPVKVRRFLAPGVQREN
jgi:hypothetical protein